MQGKLQRLVRLVGTDPGFYVLALHSFVEHYLRDVLAVPGGERFSDLVWEYREQLLEESDGGYVQGLNCLTGLGRQHRFTNMVRHSFSELDAADAAAATHLFLTFCDLTGVPESPGLARLEQSRDIWSERTSLAEKTRALAGVQQELIRLQARNHELLDRIDDYTVAENRMQRLENDIRRFTLELQETRNRAHQKDQRVDELRAERNKLRNERKDLLREMQGFHDLETYIRNLGRFSLYTRTRMDYEHSLMRLTPEQEDAVGAIDREADYLIRGSAGTGKSLILLEALRRSLQVGELEFDADPGRRAVLLTYTRTLAKFEDYVSEILGFEQISGLARTVDAFIRERLLRIDASYSFKFDIVDEICMEINSTDFFDDTELATEIEVFLFGNFITREEYVGDVVARMGMRRRLPRGQREQVWELREEVVRRMRKRGEFSRNFARMRILEYLETCSQDERDAMRDVRTIYLDETQDLTAGDLVTLKALCTGQLVMASDLQQSIYGVNSPFVRAGIRISGRTRVLRTNFRNTRQIHEVAQRFLPTEEEKLFAFRDGPIPELYTAPLDTDLLPLVVSKIRLFLNQLEYEPDNICVLAPHNSEVAHLAAELEAVRIPTAIITEREFEFTRSGEVRLSTLHSSKGLDFPVVLIYLPYLNRREKFDEQTTDRLLRNLIYVGFTRAMENLNVFVCPGDDPILGDVVDAFAAAGHGTPAIGAGVEF